MLQTKPRFSRRLAAGAATALLLGLAAYGTSRAGLLDFLQRPGESQAAPTELASAAPPTTPGPLPNYRAIVHQWGPAVVGIMVDGTRKTDVDLSGDGSLSDDPFFQFFRGLPGFHFHGPGVLRQPFHGQGSGFLISADGLVLTNAHVVRDAQEVTVRMADRRELRAKVLGADAATDIALLRVPATGLTPVRLGDPRNLQVGDYVLAIGAPFGFDQSATAGIVSALGRSLPGDAYVPYIQTDAAVNPGNSGGPLFDAVGNVVGINAQIYSQTGGYQGLAFAIPIDVAMHTEAQLLDNGRATHAHLGVLVQDLNQELAESFGLGRPDGALVSEVDPGSPAAEAGLKPGDVVTRIDGTPVVRSGDLSYRVGMDAPGTRVALQVWRNRSAVELTAKLAKADAQASTQVASRERGRGGIGLTLRALSPEECRAEGVDHGLMIESVTGPAATAGLQAGDIVLGINGQRAESVEQVARSVREHQSAVALLIDRSGTRIFVPVRLG
jgi:serine protease Do